MGCNEYLTPNPERVSATIDQSFVKGRDYVVFLIALYERFATPERHRLPVLRDFVEKVFWLYFVKSLADRLHNIEAVERCGDQRCSADTYYGARAIVSRNGNASR
jgi:hypothetical protein